MRIRYEKTEYWHPAVFAALATLALASGGYAANLIALGNRGFSAIACVTLLLFVLFAALALGKQTVSVDGSTLIVRIGWLGFRHAFALDDVHTIRVRLLNPGTSCGLLEDHDNTKRICMGQRRGVEFTCRGQKFAIGSCDPMRLKTAVIGDQIIKDDRPDYVKEVVRLPRRRALNYGTWSLI